MRRLVSLRNEYQATADLAGSRSHRLIETLFSNPVIRVTDVARRLDVTYPTARADIDKLVERGILFELSDAYPKAFYARDIFNAAYHED